MGISTFGGASGGTTTSGGSLEIGQAVQGAGGVNFLPADGRVVTKAEYPELWAALNNANVAPLTNITSSVGGVLPAALVWHVAYNAGVGLFCAVNTTTTACVTSPDGVTWTVGVSPFVGSTGIVSNGVSFMIYSATQTATSVDGSSWGNIVTLPVTLTGTIVVTGVTKNGGSYLLHCPGLNLYMTSTTGSSWIAKGVPIGRVNGCIKAGSNLIIWGYAKADLNPTNQIAVSSDSGVTWTLKTLPATDSQLCLGGVMPNGTAIIIGTTNTYYSTDDGLTWANTAHGMTSITVNSVLIITAGRAMVANQPIQINVSIFTSTNGTTWTNLSTTTQGQVRSERGIQLCGSLFILPMINSSFVLTSTDCITWSAATLPSKDTWSSAFWNGTHYVILANSANSVKSSDGINWTVASSSVPVAVTARGKVAANSTNTLFACISTGSTNQVITSADGITWTARTVTSTATWTGVSVKGSTIVIIGGGNCNSSIDSGGAWASRSGAVGSHVMNNGTNFLSVVLNSATLAAFATSPDGVTWTARSQINAIGLDVAVTSGTTFVTVANNRTVYTSADGITWAASGTSNLISGTTLLSTMTGGSGNSMHAIVLSGSVNYYATSTDATGLSWTSVSTPTIPVSAALSITYGSGGDRVLMIGGPLVITLLDSDTTLTPSTLPPNLNIHSSHYSPGVRVGTTTYYHAKNVGSNSTPFILMTSDNGATWSKKIAPVNVSSNVSLAPISVLADKIIITTENAIYTNPTGNTWVANPHIQTPSISLVSVSDYTANSWWFYNTSGAVTSFNSAPMYCNDGVTIKSTAPAGTSKGYACSNSLMVTGTANALLPSISTSTDWGDTWTVTSIPAALNTVTYGNGFWYAYVQGSTNQAARSTDGLNWSTVITLPYSQAWTVMALVGTSLVMGGTSLTTWVYTNNGTTIQPLTTTSYAALGSIGTNATTFVGIPGGTTTTQLLRNVGDPANYTQLPTYTGSPPWFIKAK